MFYKLLNSLSYARNTLRITTRTRNNSCKDK